jgi:hypothetical protein
MLNPLDLIDRLHAIANTPLPNPRPLAAYLRSRRYSPLAIDQTLRCLAEGWSVAEIWWINEDHRPAVERLLGHEGECGCDSCTDEARFRSGLLRPSGAAERSPKEQRDVAR